jgi:dTDP-4-amino-4,6-dideoxygalactose transaminase
MDLEQLSNKVSEKTAAIVAVNLFGIKERIIQIRGITEKQNIILIEDSAQSFPDTQIYDEWDGDLVVLSFGRGKPVNLLGGGIVLVKKSVLREYFSRTRIPNNSQIFKKLKYSIMASLYNNLLHPRVYWIPNKLPFLHLGETTYKPLMDIESMDQIRFSLLASNITSYINEGMENQIKLSEMLHNLDIRNDNLYDLPRLCDVPFNRKLLRYPVLVKSSIRDSLYKELLHKGLGPSIMYKCAMNDIPGMELLFIGQGEFIEAREFSHCVLTLPIHKGITDKDICNIKKTLLSLLI